LKVALGVNTTTVLRLVCIGERMTAGRARNLAGSLAGGTIVTFMDSHDLMFLERFEVGLNLFECHGEALKIVLHGYQGSNKKHLYTERKQSNTTNATQFN